MLTEQEVLNYLKLKCPIDKRSGIKLSIVLAGPVGEVYMRRSGEVHNFKFMRTNIASLDLRLMQACYQTMYDTYVAECLVNDLKDKLKLELGTNYEHSGIKLAFNRHMYEIKLTLRAVSIKDAVKAHAVLAAADKEYKLLSSTNRVACANCG